MKISIHNKKFFANILLAMVALVLFSLPHFVFADGSFICSPDSGGGGDLLFGCFNRIYNIAIVTGSIVAVFFIAWAGYLYMFSGGNEGSVKHAKEYITTSITGIIILLAGFLVLKQINPDLLNFRSISPEQITAQFWVLPDGTIMSSNKQPTGATKYDPSLDSKQCVGGIQAIPQDIAGKSGEEACASMIEPLRKVKAEATKLGINFILTDAFDRTGTKHTSRCHEVYGTCADLVPQPSSAGDNWNKLCTAVKNTGNFRILNEYDGGGAPECGNYVSTKKSTGDHIHIILQGTIDDEGSNTQGVVLVNVPASWPTGKVVGKGGAECNGGVATKASEAPVCDKYTAEIAEAKRVTGVDSGIIRTLIHIESNFSNGLTSKQNAMGLMQITPDTATQNGCGSDFATNPASNILCGARIFKKYLDRFNGNVDAAIAQYNSTVVSDPNRASSFCSGQTRWQCAFDNAEQTQCNTGFIETRNYVLNYQALVNKYRFTCD